MTKGSKIRGGEDDLSSLIRDQLHDTGNRQFLSRLPVFRPDTNTSEVFGEYLQRLDRAEAKSERSRI